MSGAPTQSEGRQATLSDFLSLRDSLREKPIGDGGRRVCLALSAALDAALQTRASQIDWPAEFALVAVGGYGRSELSPFSDVDLMVLHESKEPSDLAAQVFRPLWDAGLRVGHSIRTVEEAARAAKESFETHTTLITARMVAGSRHLLERLSHHVVAVTKARPLQRYLVEEERERRRKSPYIRMATDVKNGRGGLRTLQSFAWVHAREELIGRFSIDLSQEEDSAYETLLAVRNALHAVSGRRYDVFSHDLREPVARWLGAETPEVAAGLIKAVETADRISGQRWPEVTDVTGSNSPRLFRVLRRNGISPTDRVPTADELAEILRSGERGRVAFENLRLAGHLDQMLPEWSTVRALPQLAPFHDHPVDAHLWRTVDEMQLLVDGDDEHYSGVASEVGSPLSLTLAAFLHDIGKGHGGDHSEIGAGIAQAVCERLDCPAEVTDLVTSAVRLHLLLGQTASRRDIEDSAVIDEVAGLVGSLRLLQLLYLLTVADSRATGPTMWNDWKATLLRTLFVRVALRFGGDRPRESIDDLRARVLAATPLERVGKMVAHLEAMSSDYLTESSLEEILRHVDLVESLGDGFEIDVSGGDVADTVRVLRRSHPGFRRVVADAFAANGVDVLQARLRTRADGIIVDSFLVHDDVTGGSVAADKWARVICDVGAELAGESDTSAKVAARAVAYSALAGRDDIEAKVTISDDPASGEPVVTVKCSDRIGRLAEILAVLSDSGVEIRLAKLDSRGGELLDSFHVHPDSVPPDEPSRRNLESRIAAALD